MATFLFDDIIFGPVWSRRLGESLGINLLPSGRKVCNFNCVYCECGITPSDYQQSEFPTVSEVSELLVNKLSQLKTDSAYLNSITFAGNGEPTLHPEFDRIIDEVIKIRDRIFPNVSVAVLSNATLIANRKVFNSLLKVDLNILKLDSAIEETLRNINCPRGSFNLDEILGFLIKFKGRLTIQTLFLKGYCNGKYIDNTTDEEINAWVKTIESIKPESVMLYSLARDTAVDTLEKISEIELNKLALILEEKGIKTQVTP
ncbi:MAG TPA: radical SAM protein [Bacteroidales bacterium]|jgi:wyosine [tRNA(Phe)-imidazoG37] synthetase (radical SAM superfamily)|nr:radical SAM protein [Bacteroidales bacterium]